MNIKTSSLRLGPLWLTLWKAVPTALRVRLRVPAGDLLRDATYRRLWSSILISSFGGQVTMLALPLTAAVLLHATPTQMGWLTFTELLPFLLFSLPSGVWLDRVRKLPVYIGGEAALAVVVASVPFAWWIINFLALRQAVTPEPLLGRMTSTMRWLILLPAGPGALLGGWLGEHYGLRSSLAVAAGAALLLALAAWRHPVIRGVRELPRAESPGDALGVEAALPTPIVQR